MSSLELVGVEHPAPGKTERIGTRLGFFIGGFTSAAWAPLIPYAKSRLSLDDGSLGLLILFVGIGSLVTMPVAGWFAGQRGCKAVIRVATVLAGLTLQLLVIVDNSVALAIVLFLFGGAIGSIDVAINIQAVLVEKAHGRPLMSGFHAGWSVGGFAGAGLMAILLSLGMPQIVSTLAVVTIAIVLYLVADTGLVRYGNPTTAKHKFVFPHGLILAIAVLCFIAFLAEGSVLDWGAVLLSSNKGVEVSISGLGYVTFSAVMVICRIVGDRLVQMLGGYKILLLGGLVAATGFAVIVVATPLWIILLGFGLIGLGMSNIVPVLFSLTGKQTRMPASQAVSAVGTIAYVGILFGPAIIGGVSHFFSLGIGLAVVGVMVLAIAFSAPFARKSVE